ncbi:MAG: hypothetical protein ACK5W7_04190, partial [Gemmatimonadaceae bacterium]
MTSKTPMIDAVLVRLGLRPEWGFLLSPDGFVHSTSTNNAALATELRALLAERDALKAKAPPARKLREYKGVTFRDGKWWVRDSAIHAEPRGHVGHSSVANLLFFLHTSFTDADHAAIYA